MKKLIIILVLLLVDYTYSQTLNNVWNPSGAAGQKWTSYRFRDGAVNNTGGTYDGRVYITSAATTVGIIYYNKTSWIGGTAPSTTPDGSFGTTPPSGTWGTASPNGITVDGDEKVYVADFGNKKIAIYNGDGSSGAWMKQTDGLTDLVLTKNMRLIRAFGSGANTKIYYGDGNSVTSQSVYVISKSGSGWSESLLFNITLTTARSIQCVIAKSSGNTVYVCYNGSPMMEKYDNIGGVWTKDASFVPTGFTVSQLNGASFADASENYIAVGDGSNRTFNLLDAKTGLRIAGINFGFSSESMDNGAMGFMYDSQTFFGCGSRAAVGGYFEKITSDVPVIQGTTPYRTITAASGAYTNPNNWEYYDGSSWQTAVHYPYVIDGSVTIRNDAAISSGANLNVEELTIESGGIFTTTSGILYVNNGTGTDITVNGTLKHSSTTAMSLIFVGGATCQINDGGTYIHNTTASAAVPLNSMTFSSNSNMVYQGSSTLVPAISISGRTHGNFYIESTSGNLILSSTSGSSTLTILGNFNIGTTGSGTVTYSTNGYSGAINIANNFNIGSGSTYTCGTSIVSIGGNYSNSGTFNSGTSTFVFNGISTQYYSQSGSGNFNNLTLNNSSGLNLNNNCGVNGTLTLTNGLLTLGTNNLTLGASATIGGIPSAANMVVAEGSGELRKEFTSPGSFTFPVGDNTGTPEYSPIKLDFTSGSFSSAYAGVNLKNSASTNFYFPATHYINRCWNVTQSGISSFSCDISATYDNADVVGNENLIYASKYDGFWSIYSIADATNNILTFNGVTSFSELTGADLGATPVELSEFSASVANSSVLLKWKTISETNSSAFEVQRKSQNTEWTKIAEVNAAGNSNSPKDYSYTDRNLASGNYQYRIKMIDADGSYQFSKIVEAEINLPKEFSLSQNYPNPFNPSTVINYSLPFDTDVRLEIYSVNGELVRTLVNETQSAGNYSIEFNATELASGIYLYRMITKDFVQTKKMQLIK